MQKFVYPRLFRNLNYDKRRYEEILDSLLDLKVKKNSKYERATKKSEEAKDVKDSLKDNERVSGECSLIQNSMRNRDFKQDVLPYVYQIIHP